MTIARNRWCGRLPGHPEPRGVPVVTTPTATQARTRARRIAFVTGTGKVCAQPMLRSIRSIGRRLGFDEATNFGKFFRRETGMTPRSFRFRRLVE